MQKALSDAEHSLSLTRKEKDEKERDINRLFDPTWYGAEGEWKKLDRTCISKEVGEYVLPLSSRACEVPDIFARLQLHLRSVPVRRGPSKADQGWIYVQSRVRHARAMPSSFSYSRFDIDTSSPGTTPTSRRARRNTTAGNATRRAPSAGTALSAVSRCVAHLSQRCLQLMII